MASQAGHCLEQRFGLTLEATMHSYMTVWNPVQTLLVTRDPNIHTNPLEVPLPTASMVLRSYVDMNECVILMQ